MKTFLSLFCRLRTIGSRCRRASPVRDPTARLMQNWMHIWNTWVHLENSSTTIPNMAIMQTIMLARVAYPYPGHKGLIQWLYKEITMSQVCVNSYRSFRRKASCVLLQEEMVTKIISHSVWEFSWISLFCWGQDTDANINIVGEPEKPVVMYHCCTMCHCVGYHTCSHPVFCVGPNAPV